MGNKGRDAAYTEEQVSPWKQKGEGKIRVDAGKLADGVA